MNTQLPPNGYTRPGRSRRQLAAWCELRMKEGQPKDALIDEMIRECSAEEAQQIYHEIRRTLAGRTRKILILGIAAFILGVLFTYSSFTSRTYYNGGGFYFFFGLIFGGIACVVYALWSLSRLR